MDTNKEITARFIDKSLFLNDSTGVYFSNYIEDFDVASVPEFQIIQPTNSPEYNVTIVSKDDGHPVKDGERSIRMNWYPGDCGTWPYGGWNDCDNKRGRTEIGDINRLTYEDGPKIGWSYSMYLPESKYIIPPDGIQTVIFQIYHHTDNWLKPLLFLRANPSGSISVTDHEPFNNNTISRTEIISKNDVFNRWIDIEVIVEFLNLDSAIVSFWIDGQLVHQIERDMANQGDGKLEYEFRAGFYNGYFDNPREWSGWVEQLMYLDNIVKKNNDYY